MTVRLTIGKRTQDGDPRHTYSIVTNAGGDSSVETFHWLHANAPKHFVRTSDGWALRSDKVAAFVFWAQTQDGIEIADKRDIRERRLSEIPAIAPPFIDTCIEDGIRYQMQVRVF